MVRGPGSHSDSDSSAPDLMSASQPQSPAPQQGGGVSSDPQAIAQQLSQLAQAVSGMQQQMQTLPATVLTHVQAQLPTPTQPTYAANPVSQHTGLPSCVKLDKPRVFSGSYDLGAVANFIDNVDRYFSVTGMVHSSPALQGEFASMLLTDQAALWYRTQYTTTPDWPMLRHALRTQFTPVDESRRARDKLAVLTQGKKTVVEYVQTFQRLQLAVTDASPGELIDRFIRGLRPELQSYVWAQPAATQALSDAMQIAQRIEAAFSTGKQTPAPVVRDPDAMDLGYMRGGRRGRGRYARGNGRSQKGRGPYSSNSGGAQRCYNCGQRGHFKRECPHKARASLAVMEENPAGSKNLQEATH